MQEELRNANGSKFSREAYLTDLQVGKCVCLGGKPRWQVLSPCSGLRACSGMPIITCPCSRKDLPELQAVSLLPPQAKLAAAAKAKADTDVELRQVGQAGLQLA